jgi:hypothetical protein
LRAVENGWERRGNALAALRSRNVFAVLGY